MKEGSKNLKILVVDDEPDIVEILSYNLKKEGYQVVKAFDGEEALKVAKLEKPDMVLLDVMMPEKDGVETCTQMRKLHSLNQSLIVFLSARSEEFTQLAAFEAGANDYITKPIKPKILLKKIESLFELISTENTVQNELVVGDLSINKNTYEVKLKNDSHHLPRKEFELLFLLASEPNKVFNREQILNEVWGEGVVVGGRTIDVHIRKIREKLGIENIKTIKGVGYKYQQK